MVQIDIPFTFGVGSLFAAAAEEGLRSRLSAYFYYRALTLDLLFQIVLVIWFPLYFLVNQFGLETSHMWWHGEGLRDYPWMLPSFVVVYFASNVSGYNLGVWLIRRGHVKMVWAVFWGSMTVATLWVALQPYRTLSLGTYQEWQAGTARWLWTDRPLTVAVIFDMIAFNGTLIYFYQLIKREAARAANDATAQAL